MARRNQPYLPLYVQDYLTDEKLNRCSAATQGVFIKIMCVLHKTETYGTILLKQKDKQNGSKISDFAAYMVRQLPFSKDEIESAMGELVDEGVLIIDGDAMYQKRMVKDYLLSEKRAESGAKGGQKSKGFAQAKGEAKSQANSDIEIDNDIPLKEVFINYGLGLLNKNEDYRFAIEAKYDTWVADGWKDGFGAPIIIWKNKLRNAIPHMKPMQRPAATKEWFTGQDTTTGEWYEQHRVTGERRAVQS